MGTSDWLGTQMQMKRAGNDESFDFLTEHVVGEMWNILNGLGISIVSTSKGVMSDQQAAKNNVGGEILCEVF